MSGHYIGKRSSLDLAKVVTSNEARATNNQKFFSHNESFVSGMFFFLNLNLLFIIEFKKFTVHA